MAAGQMRVVGPRDAKQPPAWCAFTHDFDSELLDTGRYLTNVTGIPSNADPYGYVQVAYVKEMGRAVGMVEREEVELIAAEVRRLLDELEAIRTRCTRLEAANAVLEEVAA